jgi:hypothetical protein
MAKKDEDVLKAFTAGAILGAVVAGPEGALAGGLVAAYLESTRGRKR